MTEHKLKLPEPYFTEVLEGRKTFEIRRNDRGFQRGDKLVLWDVTSCDCGSDTCPRVRPSIEREVSFVFAGDPALLDLGGILPGYVILGLLEPEGVSS
jgi:hypothetical protein